MIYAQSIAAYHAGFEADATGDSDFAGCSKGALGGKHFRRADKAILKLVGLSPVGRTGSKPLSQAELKAKARVCQIMDKHAGELTPSERCFVRVFAREVEDFLAAEATS